MGKTAEVEMEIEICLPSYVNEANIRIVRRKTLKLYLYFISFKDLRDAVSNSEVIFE